MHDVDHEHVLSKQQHARFAVYHATQCLKSARATTYSTSHDGKHSSDYHEPRLASPRQGSLAKCLPHRLSFYSRCRRSNNRDGPVHVSMYISSSLCRGITYCTSRLAIRHQVVMFGLSSLQLARTDACIAHRSPPSHGLFLLMLVCTAQLSVVGDACTFARSHRGCAAYCTRKELSFPPIILHHVIVHRLRFTLLRSGRYLNRHRE